MTKTSNPHEFLDSPFFPAGMPQPDPANPVSRGFYEACAEGRLVVQACNKCAAVQHPPEVVCHQCHGFDLGWKEVAGLGHVYTYTIVWNPAHPALREFVPYNVCLVQLDDEPGFYLLSNVVDAKPEEIVIGMPVEVVFERTAEDLVQPRWRRRA
jgi:uncharacterized OB-fold protein